MSSHTLAEPSIQSTLPRPWEVEETFADTLYDWMARAPWLAISAAAHLIVFLILALVPWHLLRVEEPRVVQSRIVETPPEPVDDPLVEEPDPVETLDDVTEPVLQEALVDEAETPDDAPYEDAEGDPDFSVDAPFEDHSVSGIIGIGDGPGGKFGGRLGRGRPGGRRGAGVEQAVADGLHWLKDHQSPDGYWDCDNFMNNCVIGSSECDGAGEEPHDVGITGLALLAFLGDGHTTRHGQYREVVTRGVKWLKEQQDFDTGLLGEKIGHSYMYNHGLGCLALTEAYYFSKSPLLRGPAQKAINFITVSRNPYGAWRYDSPPIGTNDTSVTGWMVMCLASAKDAGLKTDPEAFRGALSWLDEVTDPATGRMGYDSIGSMSSRVEGVNSHYPPEKGEAMTGVGLLCRFFLGQDPADAGVMEKHAELMLKKLPEWDPDGFGCDMYYWYYASYAMYQMGGSKYWQPWNKAMKEAVVESQRKDGDFKGSWDPIGPWGYSGGRVYSTALMTLCLEVYYRYARIVSAR